MGALQPKPFDPDSFGPLPVFLRECIGDNDVAMFGSYGCRYCRLACKLFNARDIPFKMISTSDGTTYLELYKYTKTIEIPQIFIEKKFIGGYRQLKEWDFDGKMAPYSNYHKQFETKEPAQLII